jgi:hypothetical protein
LLHSSNPTVKQIKFWDSWLVRISVKVDPFLKFKLGKSVLVIWQKISGAEKAQSWDNIDPPGASAFVSEASGFEKRRERFSIWRLARIENGEVPIVSDKTIRTTLLVLGKLIKNRDAIGSLLLSDLENGRDTFKYSVNEFGKTRFIWSKVLLHKHFQKVPFWYLRAGGAYSKALERPADSLYPGRGRRSLIGNRSGRHCGRHHRRANGSASYRI